MAAAPVESGGDHEGDQHGTGSVGAAHRLGQALRLSMRFCVGLPPFLDAFKLMWIALAVTVLKRRFMRGFQPRIASDYGFELAGRPTDSTLNGIVFYRGRFEPVLSEVVDRCVRPGDLCVDAGSNVGYFTLLFCRKAGATGRVISIEAAPGNFRRLATNVAHNGFRDRVEIIEKACAGAAGESTFYIHARNDMLSRMTLPGKGELDHWLMGGTKPWRPVTVKTDTLLGMLGNRAAEVTFVKLDIEGAEHLVVRELIAHCIHPRLQVALEAKAPNIRKTLEPFEAAGFHLYDLLNDYRWLLNARVNTPLACSYESIYARKFMADVLLTRLPLDAPAGEEALSGMA
ncbi:MAG: FkbM family methyltransferase [Ramlibacter sp.]